MIISLIQHEKSSSKAKISFEISGKICYHKPILPQTILNLDYFQASARPSHPSDAGAKKILLTNQESDNLYLSLEEDYNSVSSEIVP